MATPTTSVLSAMGFGAFRYEEQAATDAVTSALSLGYRHIDTAQFYGNKVAVGRAIRESDVPRDDIFLTTKVRHDRLHHDDLIASLRESLDKLGIKQVDLALIRWPSPEDEVPMAEYIAALWYE